jgi:hypothetical protein
LRGLWFKDSLGQKLARPTSQSKAGHSGTCLSSQLGGSLNKRITVQASLGINARPYSKNTKAKRAEGVAQVLEHPPGKHKTLSSNASTRICTKKTP